MGFQEELALLVSLLHPELNEQFFLYDAAKAHVINCFSPLREHTGDIQDSSTCTAAAIINH